MINVKIKPNEIIIDGHANSAPKGEDLVCCAVSTLYYALIANLLDITDNVDYDGEDGHARVKCKEFSRDAHRCFKFFRIGIKHLADKYPKNINIEK